MSKKQDGSTEQATEQPAIVQEEAVVTEGTTSILFPELKGESEAPPVSEKEDKEAIPVETEPVVKSEAEAKYLDDLSYKVKTKINGEESEVTLEELRRGYQTAQHLTKEGQRLADERRRIEADRAELAKLKNPDDYSYNPYSEVEKSEEQKRIERIEKEFEMMAPMLGKIKYQEDLKILDVKMKQEGLDDFEKFVPAIESYILNQPIERQHDLRTYEEYERIYKTEKLKEFKSMAEKKKNPDERVKPKVMPIETSNANTASDDDEGYDTVKRNLYEKAKKTGNQDAWQQYFEHMNSAGRLFKRPA